VQASAPVAYALPRTRAALIGSVMIPMANASAARPQLSIAKPPKSVAAGTSLNRTGMDERDAEAERPDRQQEEMPAEVLPGLAIGEQGPEAVGDPAADGRPVPRPDGAPEDERRAPALDVRHAARGRDGGQRDGQPDERDGQAERGRPPGHGDGERHDARGQAEEEVGGVEREALQPRAEPLRPRAAGQGERGWFGGEGVHAVMVGARRPWHHAAGRRGIMRPAGVWGDGDSPTSGPVRAEA
jgi:hypothetical protein